jgi:mannosyltransferase
MQLMKEACASQKRLAGLLLILIIGFAVVIRIYHLGAESVWLDEAYSIKFAHLPVAAIVDAVTREDVHPPLYYLILHYWVMLAGDSESAVRLLSVLFGALSIVVLYGVAALIFDRWTGVTSAVLLALSQMHMGFSQEARMYALLCLLALLSIYFFIRLFDDEPGMAFVGYVMCSALLVYTQIYGWFIIAAQNFFLLSLCVLARDSFKRVFRRWLLAQAILLALFLPWLPMMRQQISRVQKEFWIPAPSLKLLGLTLDEYAASNLLLWIYLLLIVFCIVSRWKSEDCGLRIADCGLRSSETARGKSWFPERYRIYFLLTWLLTSVLVPFILSYFTRPIFLPKYTVASLPAFIILAARGMMKMRFAPARLFLIALVVGLSLTGLPNYWGTQRRTDWRDAVGYFNRTAKPNDLVLFYPSFSQVPFDYYSRHADVIKKPFPDYNSELTANNVDEMLGEAAKGHDRVWLVLHSLENESTLLLKKHLGDMYNLRAQEIVPGIEIYLYEGRRSS